MLTAQFIKEKALEYGADLVGIGDIRHFEGTHPQRDPRSILPDAQIQVPVFIGIPDFPRDKRVEFASSVRVERITLPFVESAPFAFLAADMNRDAFRRSKSMNRRRTRRRTTAPSSSRVRRERAAWLRISSSISESVFPGLPSMSETTPRAPVLR